MRRPTAMAVAMAVFDDFAPRTFSSSLMTLAGLKKWVPITLSGRLVAEGDFLGVAPPLVQQPVADAAVAAADHSGLLVEAAPAGHGGGDGRLRRLRAAHVRGQPHEVGGAEEVGADPALRPAGGRG